MKQQVKIYRGTPDAITVFVQEHRIVPAQIISITFDHDEGRHILWYWSVSSR